MRERDWTLKVNKIENKTKLNFSFLSISSNKIEKIAYSVFLNLKQKKFRKNSLSTDGK